MGEVPDWYAHIKAAKYLGVAPWDLLEQPIIWHNWAVRAEEAEESAARQKNASTARKSK
jgi:hypothetical protein